jgi:hypothetical protein
MSWDIFIFNLNRKVSSVEEIDESTMLPFSDWDAIRVILSAYFKDIIWENIWGSITRSDFSIAFSSGDPEEKPTSILMSIYGVNSIYEVIELCRQQNWQIYDTSLGDMIDIENPQRNGYENFQAYLTQVKAHIS